jgi:hypothetical protein
MWLMQQVDAPTISCIKEKKEEQTWAFGEQFSNLWYGVKYVGVHARNGHHRYEITSQISYNGQTRISW